MKGFDIDPTYIYRAPSLGLCFGVGPLSEAPPIRGQSRSPIRSGKSNITTTNFTKDITTAKDHQNYKNEHLIHLMSGESM